MEPNKSPDNAEAIEQPHTAPVSAKPEAAQDNPEYYLPASSQPQSGGHTLSRVLRVVLGIIIIGSGLVVGLFIGFSVSFGACYKSSCSPVEETAMLWAPAASLLVTVPITVRLNKPRD